MISRIKEAIDGGLLLEALTAPSDAPPPPPPKLVGGVDVTSKSTAALSATRKLLGLVGTPTPAPEQAQVAPGSTACLAGR